MNFQLFYLLENYSNICTEFYSKIIIFKKNCMYNIKMFSFIVFNVIYLKFQIYEYFFFIKLVVSLFFIYNIYLLGSM